VNKRTSCKAGFCSDMLLTCVCDVYNCRLK
jgi:hypothetical protein